MKNLWQIMCEADGLDPQRRMQARLNILNNSDALECNLYRTNDNDPDAEEEDLGDARILFAGVFSAPTEWDDEACEAFFDGNDPSDFYTAFIECEADFQSKKFFYPDVGDYVAVINSDATVSMYFIYDWNEDADGRCCVLLRDEPEIDF